MPASVNALRQSLRDARVAKGWSQRDLSDRSGLPQAHISRIENGAVDPKSSTLQELARLLDLEVILVPRSALTAVGSVLRDIETEATARPVRVIANSLARLATRLTRSGPMDPLAEHVAAGVAAVSRELAHFEPAIAKAPDVVAEMQKLAAMIETAAEAGDLDRSSRELARLTALRNTFAHRSPDTLRPAYSLDDEEG